MVFGAKVMYLGAMWRWGRVGDILADVLSYRSCLTREERGDCANSCHTPTKYYAAEGKGQKTNTSTSKYYSETRSSWLNCALRDGEAVYWVSIGHYEAVAVGN